MNTPPRWKAPSSPGAWGEIAADGSVLFLDWAQAECLSDLYRTGARRDINTAQAHFAVAIREEVLRTVIPDPKPKSAIP